MKSCNFYIGIRYVNTMEIMIECGILVDVYVFLLYVDVYVVLFKADWLTLMYVCNTKFVFRVWRQRIHIADPASFGN